MATISTQTSQTWQASPNPPNPLKLSLAEQLVFTLQTPSLKNGVISVSCQPLHRPLSPITRIPMPMSKPLRKTRSSSQPPCSHTHARISPPQEESRPGEPDPSPVRRVLIPENSGPPIGLACGSGNCNRCEGRLRATTREHGAWLCEPIHGSKAVEGHLGFVDEGLEMASASMRQMGLDCLAP